MARVAVSIAVLSVAWIVGTGCTPAGLGGNPVVWPKAARLGDTLAMSLDSNHVPGLGGYYEKFNLSQDNVTLQIRQGATVLATVTPRAVFDGFSAPASVLNLTKAGPFLTIVVFDLPTSISASFPVSTEVRLLVNGVPPTWNAVGYLQILGTGGSPIAFMIDSNPAGLGPRPMLRLQGRAAAPGVDGFDPEWEIAAIEFTLEYPSAAVSQPDVFPSTEASRAVAFTSTDDSPGTVRVFLADPRGFTLPEVTPDYPEGPRVGEGPLIDITFEKASGLGFQASDFTIRDLEVRNRDGILLSPSFSPGTDTTHYFARIARKNLAE